ncbi:GNAT family N-acetyltransferase [Pedobacter sp. SYP-B3415]|uniref:GNAT family N-acetyltransferase n=1 Tax=Pedobacter sp. SYP-B3415 TaxID=2496641 RepID=UPI00101C36A5|nr:GNAT family N-acetyltransferase [Pedobacter sp. SYP-B3415]
MEGVFQTGPEHRDELLIIWEEAVRATHHFLTEGDILFYRESLKGALPEMDLYAIADDGVLAGFINPEEGMVHALFVRPAKAGRGFGKTLMEFAIREKGISRVDVNEQNTAALAFYERLGFEVFARRELDGAGKPYPLLMLQLPEPLA